MTYNFFDQSLASITSEISKLNKRLIIKEALANGRVFPNEKYPHYNVAYNLLTKIAQKFNVGIDAIALRFCIDSIPIYKVLSGAAEITHLNQNLKADTFELEDVDIIELKQLASNPTFYWNERKQLTWN